MKVATKKQRVRSPSYPSIDLATAVDKTRVLYNVARENEILITAMLPQWGYSDHSANGMKIVAALKNYGLVRDRGKGDDRKIKVTAEGFKLIHSSDGSSEQRKLLRVAALSPKIYKYMWDTYMNWLPEDEVIRSNLVVDKKFNPAAVNGFLADYYATLKYAGLDSDDSSVTEQRLGNNQPSPVREIVSNQQFGGQTAGTQVAVQLAGAGSSRQPLERELVNWHFGKDKSFRVIVSGEIAATDIDMLIQFLELQKSAVSDG